MDEFDKPDALFEMLDEQSRTEAAHGVTKAHDAVQRVGKRSKIMRLAAPFDLMAGGTLLAVGAHPAMVASKAVVAAGAVMSSAHYLDAARRARMLRQLAFRHARNGDFEVATYLSSARISVLRALPNSSTRSAVEHLWRIVWAAQLDTTQVNGLVVSGAKQALAGLRPRQRARARHEALKVIAAVDDMPVTQDRVCAREMFLTVFEEHPLPGLGTVALELAIDYGELASVVWGQEFEDESEQLAEVDFDLSVLEEVDIEAMADDEDTIDFVVTRAVHQVASGLQMIRSELNADVADAWARKLLLDEALPRAVVLEGYGKALELAGDERLGAFRASLDQADPEKRAALKFLALDGGAIERDGGR